MQENGFAEGGRKGGRGILIAFAIGLVIGVIGTFVVQPLLGSRLPEAVRGKYEVLEGPVTAKQTEDDRLLLTVSTHAGAILATFKKRVDEINLLVEEGDTVALEVPGYQPFMQNPDIARVAKPDMPPGPATFDTPEPEEIPAPVEDAPAEQPDTLQQADSISA
jgi:hypothetical protein